MSYILYEIRRTQNVLNGSLHRISYYLLEHPDGEWTSPSTSRKYKLKYSFSSLKYKQPGFPVQSPFEPRECLECSAPDVFYASVKYTLDADKDLIAMEKGCFAGEI